MSKHPFRQQFEVLQAKLTEPKELISRWIVDRRYEKFLEWRAKTPYADIVYGFVTDDWKSEGQICTEALNENIGSVSARYALHRYERNQNIVRGCYKKNADGDTGEMEIIDVRSCNPDDEYMNPETGLKPRFYKRRDKWGRDDDSDSFAPLSPYGIEAPDYIPQDIIDSVGAVVLRREIEL